MCAIFVLIASAFGLNQKQNLKYDKKTKKGKKKREKEAGDWVTNHLPYTPGDGNLKTMRIHRQHQPPPHSQ